MQYKRRGAREQCKILVKILIKFILLKDPLKYLYFDKYLEESILSCQVSSQS